MARPTKVTVLSQLKELGITPDENASYDELYTQLAEEKLKVTKRLEARSVLPEEEMSLSQERLQAPVSKLESSDDSSEDYLQQYQWKKQAPFGSLQSNPAAGSKAETMKRFLLSQKKVTIFIPRAGGEDPTIKLSVTLNGYRLDFPKQTYLEVPLQIAEVIMDSQKQTDAAIMRNQIGLNKNKELALL